MNFDFSDEEKELKSQLRRILTENCPVAVVRDALEGRSASTAALATQLAGHGWLSIAIPEHYGGQGLGHVALCGAAEELGRVLAPIPFGSSLFLAAEALMTFGSEPQKRRYLPRLADGSLTGTLAATERAGPMGSQTITTSWSDGVLTGDKLAVADGMQAGLAVVAARSGDSVGLYLTELDDLGVSREPQQAIDPTRPLARIRFQRAPAEPLAGPGNTSGTALEQLLDRAAVLFAFEQIGSADAALYKARDYALNREAFGRPIGSFQAIKHKLAEVYIANELARANAYYGAWALAQGAPDLPLAAATARVAATEALDRAARELLQTHGGIAATWSHDCHLYYRRARHLGSCIGSVHQWRHRLAVALAAKHAA